MKSLISRILNPLIQIGLAWPALKGYLWYVKEWRSYSRLDGAEPLRFVDAYPCLHDRTPSNPYDQHYLYQDIWALKAIRTANPQDHVDVGSRAIFVGVLSAITSVIYVDIRPLLVHLENFESRLGDILSLPFGNDEVHSISCLHVAEHIGLGRYGDPLDPSGTQKAISELIRVLAPGGDLYFSLPIGRPRVQFNAHRIHTPSQILSYFKNLHLHTFSAINDEGVFEVDKAPDEYEMARYACGLFHFKKK